MALRLGDEAPNFTAETTEGTINFHAVCFRMEQTFPQLKFIKDLVQSLPAEQA